MPRNGKISSGAITGFNNIPELLQAYFTSAHLQHGAGKPSYHSSKEPVGFYMVYKGVAFCLPITFQDITVEIFDLGISF